MKIFNTALLLLLLISIGSSTAKSAELKDVQVGVDKDFTRVVFVFDEETQCILDTQSGDKIIYVHFPQAHKSTNLKNLSN